MKIKINFGFLMSALFVAGLFAVSAADVAAQKSKINPKLAKQAKITIEQARQTAQAKASGTIEEEELEKERGKLVYSFDIRNERGTITEVQVDAVTGEIAAVEEEDKQAEAKEKQEDARKKGKKKH